MQEKGKAMTLTSRKTIRLKEYDYSGNNAYFVTICTHDRQCIFGEVVNGVMTLSAQGKISYDEMLVMHNKRVSYGVSVDKFVIMPNHIHAIIIVGSQIENATTVGSQIANATIVGSRLAVTTNTNSACNTVVSRLAVTTNTNSFSAPVKNSLATIVGGYKSAVTRAINNCCVVDMASHVPTVWQRRYHEHIIRNEQDYQGVWQYIDTNPLKWELDSYHM